MSLEWAKKRLQSETTKVKMFLKKIPHLPDFSDAIQSPHESNKPYSRKDQDVSSNAQTKGWDT